MFFVHEIVGFFLGNGLKVGFKFSKGAIKAVNIIEGTCKVASNSYQLLTSTYDIGQKVGKIYYDTQVLGLDADIGDFVAIGLDVFSDAATGKSGFKEVVRLYVKETAVLIHITVSGEEITTTPDHPFRVGSIWISAKDLRAGDLLTLADGSKAAIEKIQTETLTEPVAVYNFEVADFHTYYVGNSQVLVHNDCRAGGANKPKLGMSKIKQMDLMIGLIKVTRTMLFIMESKKARLV